MKGHISWILIVGVLLFSPKPSLSTYTSTAASTSHPIGWEVVPQSIISSHYSYSPVPQQENANTQGNPNTQGNANRQGIVNRKAHRNIRIHVQYNYVEEYVRNNPSLLKEFELSKKIITSVVEYFQQNLLVNTEETVNIPSRPYDNDNQQYMFEALENAPVDLQVLIIPNYKSPGGAFAAAGFAETDSRNNRPVRGVYLLYFEPLNLETKINNYKLFSTFAHEFTHILGFVSSVFNTFPTSFEPDAAGKFSFRPENEVLKDWEIDGVSFKAVVFPELVEYAKDYFKCDSLIGVPLENGGGQGSMHSHWEKTFLPMEYMNPGVEFPALITNFTFLFLQGTNWYLLSEDYQPQHFDWGKGDGCGHFKICPEGKEYCSASQNRQLMCSHDYQSFATCTPWATFMTTCYIKSPSEKVECVLGNDSPAGARNDEYFGPHSRCLMVDFISNNAQSTPSCYKTACVGNTIQIQRGGDPRTYTCSYDSQRLRVGGDRDIICPPIEDFCGYFSKRCPLDCMGQGYCLENQQCFCQVGYEGEDCNTCTNCTKVTDPFVQGHNILNDLQEEKEEQKEVQRVVVSPEPTTLF